MLMALQPETTAITELDRGVEMDVPVRDQLSRILVELNEYLGTIISGSLTLRAARIEADLPEPTPYKLRAMLTQWLTQANAASLLTIEDARTTADVMIGTLESRHIHAYMQQVQLSSKQHRDYIRAMLDVLFPSRA
jgi:uridine kinase